MIAVDTNLLVYAHREISPWHGKAAAILKDLAEGSTSWAIPWPCIHEFLGVVTHPRIYDPPTPLTEALEQVEAWVNSPSVVLLAESGQYWKSLKAVASSARIAGPKIHDAKIAALCIDHGIEELYSADRDFSSFKNIKTRNPLVE